jgi:hypothetical protein
MGVHGVTKDQETDIKCIMHRSKWSYKNVHEGI